MQLPMRSIDVPRGDRSRLERLIRTIAPRVVERVRIVLAAAEAAAGRAICARAGVSRPTVTLWLNRS